MGDDEKPDLIRAYKVVLREALETRPSGIRLRIADAIGKNKSFISQITSPRYKTPLPEKYVEPILGVVQLAAEERERFLQVYRRAHPPAGELPADWQDKGTTRVLRIELPKLGSRALENKLDALLVDFAHRMSDLVGAEQ
jgi:hypothetical protein